MSELPSFGSTVELNWKASKNEVASLVRQLARPYTKQLVALKTDPEGLTSITYDLGHNGRGLDSFPDFKIAVPPLNETARENEISMPPRYLLNQLAQAVEAYLAGSDQQLSRDAREYVTRQLGGLKALAGFVQDTAAVKLTVRGGVRGRPLEITQSEIENINEIENIK